MTQSTVLMVFPIQGLEFLERNPSLIRVTLSLLFNTIRDVVPIIYNLWTTFGFPLSITTYPNDNDDLQVNYYKIISIISPILLGN